MKNKVAIFLLTGIMLVNACSYRKADQLYPYNRCAAGSGSVVSFSKDIVPILSTNCAIAGCHSGAMPEGNLNLDSAHAYAALSKPGSGYIDTLNPESSLFYAQLLSVSEPMPPTYRLDSCSMQRILNWLRQKASNN